jgi:glycosyltransferase involved in cell wall biosynthesis
MPSGEVETFGVVFAEAQAMRVPVVSFASGGIPEVVAQGVSGFLANEGDIGSLAGYLERLLADAELRDRMGRSGRARAEEFFDLAKQNAKLEALYDRLQSHPAYRDAAGQDEA